VSVEGEGAVVLRRVEHPSENGDQPVEATVSLAGWTSGGGVTSPSDDPFADPAPDAASGAVNQFWLLSDLGLPLSEGASVSLNASSGDLTVRGTPKDLAVARAVSDLVASPGAPQLYLQAHLVQIPNAGALADQILDGGEVDLLLRELGAEAGAETVSMPSIVTRPGQTARVEVVRDTATGPDAVEQRGFSLAFDPSVEGEHDIYLTGSLDLNLPGDPAAGQVLGFLQRDNDGRWEPAPQDSAPASRQVTDFEAALRDGQSAALMAFDDGAGGKVLALVSARLIGADGSPVHPPE
jgi:hypothetical protein